MSHKKIGCTLEAEPKHLFNNQVQAIAWTLISSISANLSQHLDTYFKPNKAETKSISPNKHQAETKKFSWGKKFPPLVGLLVSAF